MNKIRVGLLVDDLYVANWVYKLIEKINSSSFAEIVLVVKKEDATGAAGSTLATRLKNLRYFSFFFYKKIENKLHKVNNDAFTRRDASALLQGVPVVSVKPRQTKFSDYIEGVDIKKVREYNIDVFVRIGFRIIRGEILSVPKYGIWSYHHGDNSVNRGMPAGAWEFIEKWHTTGSVLQILTDELDGGKLLYRSHSATNTAFLNESMNNYYWKSVLFVPRMLKRLYEDREHFTERYVKPLNTHPGFYSGPLYTTPTNRVILKMVANKVWGTVKRKIKNLGYFDQWAILYHIAKTEGLSLEIYKYKKLIPPKDRFWADPHVIYENRKYYIFLEEVFYNNPKGHISVIELDEKGNASEPLVVLNKPYHLSYPFVFRHEGKTYMIPETRNNKTIELYESEEFPLKWKLKLNLMENVNAVDTTLLFHNNKWWLFANMQEIEGASTSDELFLFYANDLFTQNWTSHPLNPIVSNIGNARPGGKIFEYNGNIYRPAQMCAYYYGWGIAINHIKKLTETEYEEQVVNNITPTWTKNVRQAHTLTLDHKITVIDANLRRRK